MKFTFKSSALAFLILAGVASAISPSIAGTVGDERSDRRLQAECRESRASSPARAEGETETGRDLNCERLKPLDEATRRQCNQQVTAASLTGVERQQFLKRCYAAR
jgi:hypothetical protein